MNEEAKNQRIAELYETLDATVRELTTLELVDEGLVTDWLVGVAVQTFDDEGDVLDTVEPLLPNRGRGTPRYRTVGLLKDLMTQYEALTGHVTISALHRAMEDGDEDDE